MIIKKLQPGAMFSKELITQEIRLSLYLNLAATPPPVGQVFGSGGLLGGVNSPMNADQAAIKLSPGWLIYFGSQLSALLFQGCTPDRGAECCR